MSTPVFSGLNTSLSEMENFMETNKQKLPGSFTRILGKELAQAELEKINDAFSFLQEQCNTAEQLLEKIDSIRALAESGAALLHSLPEENKNLPDWLSSVNGMIAGLKSAGLIIEKFSQIPDAAELQNLKQKLLHLSGNSPPGLIPELITAV